MLDRLRRGSSARRALRAVSLAANVPAAAHALVSWRGRPTMDRDWYAAQGYLPSRGQLAHYLLAGRRSGWSPHPLLEPSWVAPASWRRRFPDPLAAPDLLSATHPALVPGALTVRAARTLPRTAEVATVLGGPVGYGDLRAAVVAAAGERREQESLRTLPRVRDRWTSPPASSFGPADLPTVSVVMPVRDRPRQVVDAIESVRAQTHRDWQLVVVDDGSSDTTPDVVAAIAARDPRVELVRADHGGVSAARNLGAVRATGEVLAWLDSDNTWTPDHLRTMLATLAATGADSAYAVLEQHAADGVRYRALDAGRPALALRNHIDLNVLVARRHVVEAVGGFDTSLRRAVDYDLVLRLAERSRPLFVPVVGARYDARRDAADRVTVRESSTWSDVVRARRLVDWAALGSGLDDRVADRLSVVVVVAASVPA
ncbi:MAG: glycosyltransferase, partial [Actinomycetota bacterium]